MAQTAITKPKLLLGEGKHEVSFFNKLLEHLGIDYVQVDEYGGKYKIGPGIKALTKRSGFNDVVSLAITRDADYADDVADNAQVSHRAFNRVCTALRLANLPVPNAPMVKTPGPPEVSIFILPDNQGTGMLEDVCIASMSNLDIECIDQYFECIRLKTSREQIRRNISKSRVHAWLATQGEPDLHLGQAAEKSYWDWNHPAFDLIKQFLQQI